MALPEHEQGTPPAPAADRRSSYNQILKASVLVGGASAISATIGVARTKIVAVLLGPAGIGFMGVYSSILDLALSISSMGIGSSGVRHLAQAASSGNDKQIARTIVILRRLSLLLGLIGATLLALLSFPLSHITFGNSDHTIAIASLSAALLLRLISTGQGVLLHGLRRIGDMAKMNVIGAIAATAGTIALVILFRQQGIAPSIVLSAAIGLATSWWYARRVETQRVEVSASEFSSDSMAVLRLGFAFMISSLLMMAASYGVRAILIHDYGLHSAGLYQAAWAIAGIYVGFVLQAMGVDFYPRLVGVINDHAECNRIVNEQTHVSLLVAGPGVIGTIMIAPFAITTLYSEEFRPATELLRWLCMGIALRVLTWPVGYIIVAKNNPKLLLLAEAAWAVTNLILTWSLIQLVGLNGAGIAFLGSYAIHALIVLPIAYRLTHFRWSRQTLSAGAVFIGLVTITFTSRYILPAVPYYLFGAVTLVVSAAWSIYQITKLASSEILPRRLGKILVKLRIRTMNPEIQGRL